MGKYIKYIAAAFAAVSFLSSCEEWEPVYTFKYDAPEEFKPVLDIVPNIDIKTLASRYTPGGSPVYIEDDVIIAGRVISSDRSGNIYKSLYIQDETGGIEVKTGRTSMYNDYKEGQTVYVKCKGLTLGMYGYKEGNYGGSGMVQLGMEDPTGEYETSYMDLEAIVNEHIFKGPLGPKVEPVTITASQLPGTSATIGTCPYIGTLVTLKDLRYNNAVFALLYLDMNQNHKDSKNRIFVADKQWGVTTWAMSKGKMTEYLLSGVWDSIQIGNSGDYNYGTVGDKKGDGTYPGIEKQAASVSHYFKMGTRVVQIRSSGYGKWGDYQIPADILNGSRTIDVTGILTMYQGSVQFTLLELEDVKYHDTGEPIDKQI